MFFAKIVVLVNMDMSAKTVLLGNTVLQLRMTLICVQNVTKVQRKISQEKHYVCLAFQEVSLKNVDKKNVSHLPVGHCLHEFSSKDFASLYFPLAQVLQSLVLSDLPFKVNLPLPHSLHSLIGFTVCSKSYIQKLNTTKNTIFL